MSIFPCNETSQGRLCRRTSLRRKIEPEGSDPRWCHRLDPVVSAV